MSASNHRPRRRFGQHFLHDPAVVARIIEEFDPRPGQAIVEIGPGKGALTHHLMERAHEIQAVELDRDLVSYLQATYPQGLTVHQADALNFDFCRLAPSGKRLRLIGNLPYNISTPLLFRLLDLHSCLEDMLFMLQKEVVDRLAAEPGGKDYGRLSVMVQWRCRVEQVFRVSAGSFSPPPRVESAVVRLIPYQEPPLLVRDAQRFHQLVQTAFSQRRKVLRNSLQGLMTSETLMHLGIDPGRRAETLTLQEFAALANAVDDETG